MKALTLTQPWASLVACGAKRIETRSWRTDYRGPLAIHAGKGLGGLGAGATESDLTTLLYEEPFRQALFGDVWLPPADVRKSIPRGAIVAVCRLGGCVPTSSFDRVMEAATDERRELERAFGNYGEGRWAWLLNDVRRLDEPVEIPKGAVRDYRGLWDVPDGLRRLLLGDVAA